MDTYNKIVFISFVSGPLAKNHGSRKIMYLYSIYMNLRGPGLII